MDRKQKIELAIQQKIGDGEEPIKALEEMGRQFNINESSLHLLRRDNILQKFFELEPVPLNTNPYDVLNEEITSGTKFGIMSRIDSEFIINMHHKNNSQVPIIRD